MIGELAALGTSLAFSFGSVFLTLAGRRVGSIVLNRTRLLFAIVFLGITHWITLGIPIPLYAEPHRWLWLGLSGVVGLVLGDVFLFQAFVWIGPRLSMLMMSLVPIFAAFLAWIFLGEQMGWVQIIGVLITLGGVVWVVMEQNDANKAENPNYARGILYGLAGAIGQASGLILAKNGLGGEFSPISANIIRMICAAVVLWIIALLQGQAKETVQIVVNNRRGLLFIVIGAVFGPFLGVSFSMLAIQRAQVGIASTLMALPPVFLLPISYFVFKERYGWGVIVGTAIAIAGVAVLFLI
ncbi:MAG: DMT family transporter [Anaerolineales bacterium]|nr:DMT family transporter [Chloroflexota bacterium]MBL6980541.1 DMT family transporter [Anaerolineales bacterium]